MDPMKVPRARDKVKGTGKWQIDYLTSILLYFLYFYILLTLFLIPFVSLISRKVKSMFPVVFVIALLVFSGLVVERLIYLLPVANLSVLAVLLPLIILGFPFIYLFFSQYRSISEV
jgi:hypothetical protein